jgi:hypothetical protein
MKTFETWLPVFPGFYETSYSFWNNTDIEQSIWNNSENIKQEYKDYILNNIWDCMIYSSMEEKITKQCIYFLNDYLQKDLNLTDSSFEFQTIDHPREYNFRNDSVNVIFKTSQTDLELIEKYLIDNEEKYTQYVKENFTSCSGFWSFHSNDINDWYEEIENIVNGQKESNQYILGSVLNFILFNHYNNNNTTSYDDIESNMLEHVLDWYDNKIDYDHEKLVENFNMHFGINEKYNNDTDCYDLPFIKITDLSELEDTDKYDTLYEHMKCLEEKKELSFIVPMFSKVMEVKKCL